MRMPLQVSPRSGSAYAAATWIAASEYPFAWFAKAESIGSWEFSSCSTEKEIEKIRIG
jgi:hypothetical protein